MAERDDETDKRPGLAGVSPRLIDCAAHISLEAMPYNYRSLHPLRHSLLPPAMHPPFQNYRLLLLGAIECGVMVSNLLFGFVTMQAFFYYQKYPGDRWPLKTLVRNDLEPVVVL